MLDVIEADAGISEELQKELDRDGIVIYKNLEEPKNSWNET